MPNSYENQLIANPETFLGKYALNVLGVTVHPLATPNPTGGQTLADEYQRQGFATSAKPVGGGLQKSGISLTAPLVSACISKSDSRLSKADLPFSRAVLEVKFQHYQNGIGVPAYLIPYEGAMGRGVRLPAHGSDAFDPVFCFTATQTGCTVDVSGDTASPFAAHTNVIDVKNANAVARFNSRRQKMNDRLAKLQQRFAAADVAANGGPSAVGQHWRLFNHYAAMPPGGGGPGPDEINYTEIANRLVRSKGGGYVFLKHLTHQTDFVEFFATPTRDAVDDNTDPMGPPKAILLGMRTAAAGWAFYYQVYSFLTFNIVSIVNNDATTMQPELQGGRIRRYPAIVVLDRGQFWPNPTSHPW